MSHERAEDLVNSRSREARKMKTAATGFICRRPPPSSSRTCISLSCRTSHGRGRSPGHPRACSDSARSRPSSQQPCRSTASPATAPQLTACTMVSMAYHLASFSEPGSRDGALVHATGRCSRNTERQRSRERQRSNTKCFHSKISLKTRPSPKRAGCGQAKPRGGAGSICAGPHLHKHVERSDFPAGMHGGDAARQIAVGDPLEPRETNHLSKSILLGELADAFDQILVGLGCARRQLPQPRNDLEGMKVVQRVETGTRHSENSRHRNRPPGRSTR